MSLRIVVCACAVLIAAGVAMADVPQLINYQGMLKSGEDPVTTPTAVLFAIWNDPTDGDSLWSEIQPVSPDDDGRFSVLLGSVSPIPDSAFSGADVYLSMKVDTDPEMTPRSRLASVPYAYLANMVEPSTPIMWSGGCTNHGTAAGWNKYCTNGVDFNTASGYLSVAANGTFTVLIAGYYRINAWAANFCNSQRFIKIDRNGVPIHYDYQINTGSDWRTVSADVTWRFNAGDTFEVYYYNDGGGYAYHSWSSQGQHSRLQVTYVGP
jgi:hypothetical protein